MRDIHPLLVLSPKEFNARTGIVIGLPMTTASFNKTNPFAVRIQGPKGVVSYILSHQPKSFDGAREARSRIRGSRFLQSRLPKPAKL